MLAEPNTNSSKSNVTRESGRGLMLDDTHLWQNIRKDNELAFSILYKKYVQRLYSYGMHYCHKHDLVTDCLQELFTSIWTKRSSLSVVHSVSAYLFKSFRRLLIKKITWSKRFLLALEPSHERFFEVSLPIEQVIENHEREVEWNARINHSLKGLSKRQREAIFLRFYNDLSYAEIASVMEMQVDSVYNTISKAIESLRQQLKNAVPLLWTAYLLIF